MFSNYKKVIFKVKPRRLVQQQFHKQKSLTNQKTSNLKNVPNAFRRSLHLHHCFWLLPDSFER
jgi:hypothetical protein